MPDVRVNDIRAIHLAVRDVKASTRFYVAAWGLEEAGRDRDTVYLRATGREHHVLALTHSPQIGLLGASFAAADKAAVDGLYAKAVAFGAEVAAAPHALTTQAGGGYGFSFRTPDGIAYCISSDVARQTNTIDDRRRPNKFSHMVLRSADYPQLEHYFCDLLGFKVSDRTDGLDFLRCSNDHHSVALGRLSGHGLHHMAFAVPDFDGLMGASGRVSAQGYPVEWGVGRHAGPGNNIFSFFVDPNGFATEYTTEMDQVDDAYPVRPPEYWRMLPLRPCAWGMATQRSDRLMRARNGTLIAEINQSCTETITRTLRRRSSNGIDRGKAPGRA